MTTTLRWWQRIFGQRAVVSTPPPVAPVVVSGMVEINLHITPGDPLFVYLQSNPKTLIMENLTLRSPAVEQLRAAGVQMIVPLVNQGELIGIVNIGDRMSEQLYSIDDRKLLDDLAVQAAPAVRVAQLVQRQRAEARERERIEQELRVARVIQQTLLPQTLPTVAGWHINAHYQPAREVGGDFYDFVHYPDGRLGVIIADVTDKGVPAALVMATTRAILRAASERLGDPGQVLERANDVLCPDIPAKMFVTCFYAILDPATGVLQYANAGHDLPYRFHAAGVEDLRATGMPLGLLPGMRYEVRTTTLAPGDVVVLHSDGVAEAHDPARAMYGFPRLKASIAAYDRRTPMIDHILADLHNFTGVGWEQEDDVTLVTLRRENNVKAVTSQQDAGQADAAGWLPLDSFELPSAPGNERQAMQRVGTLLAGQALGTARLEKLKTAVAEATMNGMEHGNGYDPTKPVAIAVWQRPGAVRVTITDRGSGPAAADQQTEPDLLAKLAGEQSPRGWGLFLIKNMVDELHVDQSATHHTVELIVTTGAQTE